jgi:hypothetical protein
VPPFNSVPRRWDVDDALMAKVGVRRAMMDVRGKDRGGLYEFWIGVSRQIFRSREVRERVPVFY